MYIYFTYVGNGKIPLWNFKIVTYLVLYIDLLDVFRFLRMILKTFRIGYLVAGLLTFSSIPSLDYQKADN